MHGAKERASERLKGHGMSKGRITALILSAVLLLTGCRPRFEGSGIFQMGSGSVIEDERYGEDGAIGVSSQRPSKMLELTSQELVSSIRVGWNLGNALEACRGDLDGDGKLDAAEADVVDELFWGNPAVTRDLFKALVDSGVNAVRLPVTWRNHIDENGTIDVLWLNRIQQIVDFAYSVGLYIVINMQHDGAEDELFGAWLRGAQDDANKTTALYTAVWAQIADRFKNYNERLIFESMNDVEFARLDEDSAYALLNSLNQSFVDAVRASGGNNAERHLMIAGYGKDISKTCDERFHMPNDPAARCILSVNYYTPWEFCTSDLESEWGTRNEEREMDSLISVLKETYTDRGTAVVIAEYGAVGDSASVEYFCERLAKTCHDSAIACFIWDDGSLFDREQNAWNSSSLIDALNRAASGEEYVPEKRSGDEEAA